MTKTWVSLILAAGRSSRFGSTKALAEINGQPLIQAWIELFEKCGAQHHFVVINEISGPEIQRALMDKIKAPTKMTWVLQQEPLAPPFSSLKKAISAIQNSALTIDGAFLTPVDVLPPGQATIEKILNCFLTKNSHEIFAIRPTYQTKRGHPVFLSSRILTEISLLDPEKNRLDDLLHRHQNHVFDVAVEDEKILSNVNTPDQIS